MEEKHTITMANGTKVHLTLHSGPKAGPFLDVSIDEVELPKPEYKYSTFKSNLKQPPQMPFLWKRTKDNLGIFLKLVDFHDNNGKHSIALVMTDKYGQILEGGVLLKFREDSDLAMLIPDVGDQYPGVRGLNGEIGVGMPEVTL